MFDLGFPVLEPKASLVQSRSRGGHEVEWGRPQARVVHVRVVEMFAVLRKGWKTGEKPSPGFEPWTGH